MPRSNYWQNTKDTPKFSARVNHKGYPATLYGIMPLNYSQMPQQHYQADCFLSLKKKSLNVLQLLRFIKHLRS